VVCYWINAFYTPRFLHYSWGEQLKDLLPAMGSSIFMGAIVFLAGYIPIPSMIIQLLLQIAIGVGVYLLLCWLFRIQIVLEGLALFKNKVGLFLGQTPDLPVA
jgi:membrane-bound acyltransferase YfiQ involved in biofilm formation